MGLEDRIAESHEIESILARIQSDRTAGLTPDEVKTIINRYHEWYADCLRELPDDLKARFRSEYEGSPFSHKVKHFVNDPLQVNPLFRPEALPTPFITYWTFPYDRVVKGPMQSQRQIIIEAQRRNPLSDLSMQAVQLLEGIIQRFDHGLRPLKERHSGRTPFAVGDEYDVQDVVQAVLTMLFDDVREEEHSPSRAGSASRLDFLLKREQVVIETKMTRQGLGAKEVGAELLIDIGRYRAHPDCKALVILVYDPDGRIANPRGLEGDLNGSSDGLQVRVVVSS